MKCSIFQHGRFDFVWNLAVKELKPRETVSGIQPKVRDLKHIYIDDMISLATDKMLDHDKSINKPENWPPSDLLQG